MTSTGQESSAVTATCFAFSKIFYWTWRYRYLAHPQYCQVAQLMCGVSLFEVINYNDPNLLHYHQDLPELQGVSRDSVPLLIGCFFDSMRSSLWLILKLQVLLPYLMNNQKKKKHSSDGESWDFWEEEQFDKSSLNFGVIPLFWKKAIALFYMIF